MLDALGLNVLEFGFLLAFWTMALVASTYYSLEDVLSACRA